MKCDVCDCEIQTNWSDNEAIAEYETTFGVAYSANDCVFVCHECYTARHLYPTPTKHHITTPEFTDTQIEKMKRVGNEC